jgi:hypothetical protein
MKKIRAVLILCTRCILDWGIILIQKDQSFCPGFQNPLTVIITWKSPFFHDGGESFVSSMIPFHDKTEVL